MDTSTVETILSAWWQICAIILALAIAIITIRITVKFDINAWMKARREAKAQKERRKKAENCLHAWTLYTHNPVSRCGKCMVLIDTAILLSAKTYLNPKPVILAEAPFMTMTTAAGELVTSDYIGHGD